MSKRADRRIQRTKKALREALLSLMLEKGYDQVTTRDIVDRADVGRSTFYAHYADKEDLLQENLEALADHLRDRMLALGRNTVPASLAFALPMLEHMSQVRQMFAGLLGPSGSGTVQRMFHETLCQLVSQGLDQEAKIGSAPRTVLVEFAAAGFMAVAKWWVAEAPDRSTQEVHRIYLDLMLPIISGTGIRPR